MSALAVTRRVYRNSFGDVTEIPRPATSCTCATVLFFLSEAERSHTEGTAAPLNAGSKRREKLDL